MLSWLILLIGVAGIVLGAIRLRRPAAGARRTGLRPAAQIWLGVSFVIGSVRQLSSPPHTLDLIEDVAVLVAAVVALAYSVRDTNRR
jgi:hypothetical protein